jgi:hypothetical protein
MRGKQWGPDRERRVDDPPNWATKKKETVRDGTWKAKREEHREEDRAILLALVAVHSNHHFHF